ncbi:MAG TPA: molybdopterin cofactor-binding domain-containing protein [Micropepsaceae bacterium]|nr:molybdopterin cofactor-binding domain-containing protein [Micropepsaceae bacterium]
MNAPTKIELSRRELMGTAGALVFAFSVSEPGAAMAQQVMAAPAGGANNALDPTELDSWLAIAPDGKVTVFFGKMDGGQGTDLAMAMIVAEEMDVPLKDVDVVEGDTARTVNQGGASGSTGVRFAGAALRQAGAEARRVLVMKAAEKLGVDASQLTVSDGVVSVAGNPAHKISYAELIGGGHFHSKIGWNKQYGNPLALTSPAKPKTHDQYKVVGTTQPRLDVKGKVFGTAPWTQDIRVEGMLHGRMVRPPIAGASVASVDESSIAKIPNVRIVRKGDFLGVVAPREWDAVKAARMLKVNWAPTTDPFPDQAKLYDHIRQSPVTKSDKTEDGQVDAAFAGAARVVQAEYEWPFQSHASMGPGCALADVRADGVTVWTGTQKPHFAAQGVAGVLGVPVEKVRAIWVAGPGSYGRNDAGDVTMDAAVLSQAVGKPVRVQYMRHEGHGWDPKAPASVHRGRAALDKDGNVVALEFWSRGFSRLETNSTEADPGDTLAGMLLGHKGKRTPAFNLPENAYTFSNKRLGWETVAALLPGASPLRTSHMRDPLGPQITFASESFMDEVAFAVGADPVEFRLNYLTEPRDRAAIQAAAEKAGWKPGKAGTRRTQRGDIVTGRGVAYQQRGGTIVAIVADAEVNTRTGEVRVPRVVVAHDCGLIVNPGALRHVVECNVVQGLSRTIHEEVKFDHRNVTSVDWLTYPIVEMADAPRVIDVVLLNHPEAISTGAGEATMRPLAAAVNNAIFEATGTRLRRAPLNAARIKASTV